MKKKILSGFISLALILSSAGCSDIKKDSGKDKENSTEDMEEDLLDLAESFCKAIDDANYKNIVKYMFEPDDDMRDIVEAKYDLSNEEYGELYTAIVDSFEYDIDKKSLEINESKGKGSIEVTFDVVDYELVFNNRTYTSYDSFVFDVGIAPESQSTDIEISFKLDDDEWFITNAEEIIDELTSYTDFKPDFSQSLSDGVGNLEWYGSIDGQYHNTTYIELDIIPNAIGYDLDWTMNYEVYLNGNLIYIADMFTDTSLAYIGGYFPAGLIEGTTTNEGYLVEGEYTVIFYDANGVEVTQSTCSVTYTEEVQATDADFDNEDSLDMLVAASFMLMSRTSHENVDVVFFGTNYEDSYWYDFGDGMGGNTMIDAVTYDYSTNPSMSYVVDTKDYTGNMIYTLYFVEDLSTKFDDFVKDSDLYYVESGYMSCENDDGIYVFDYPYELNAGAYVVYISPDDEEFQNASGGDFVIFDIAVVQ